jgi:hypothetical protein
MRIEVRYALHPFPQCSKPLFDSCKPIVCIMRFILARAIYKRGSTDSGVEQLRIGTIKAREALNSDMDVSDAQIQESLWHYFYDVGKTVTYLKSEVHPI